MGTRENRAAGQERRRNGQFGSGYSDEKLYELVREVTLAVDPDDPESISQPRFDQAAPAVASSKRWPPPPKAHAIQMRLKKPWPRIKEEAHQARSIQQILAKADGVALAPWLDERFLYFAFRRAHMHLGKKETDTLYPHEYAQARSELIAKAKRLDRYTAVEETMPTRGQLIWMLEGRWNDGLAIAGLPAAPTHRLGHPLIKVAEHYYETQDELPPTVTGLIDYAADLGISVPNMKPEAFPVMLDELIADRATRGLQTLETGPTENARLSAEAIEALILDAPKPRNKPGDWTESKVIEAFADFVEEFEGKGKLNSALYTSSRVARGWPSNNAWQKHGRFQDLVEKGRKRARERAKKAA
jgi:hypothetical protein